MRKLYLIRHGQTDWNAQRRLQGHSDIPLNAEGQKQAQSLALRLRDHAFDTVLSSDLARALKTAEILNFDRGLPHRKTRLLREIHLGEIEGLNRDQVATVLGTEFWGQWAAAHASSWKMRYPLGESKQQGVERFEKALLEFSRGSQTLAVVSHGLMIRGFLNRHCPSESSNLMINNASAVVLEKHLGRWRWVDYIQP